MKTTLTLSLVLAASACFAEGFTTSVLYRNLNRPTGIAIHEGRGHDSLLITQVPTPGVPGSMGGRNTVDQLFLRSPFRRNLTTGEPEPTNLALNGDDLYWTCKSAGVILERSLRSGRMDVFLRGLMKPSGIAAGPDGQIYFTQVPTPGVNGGNGGKNRVDVAVLGSIFNLTVGEPEPTDIAAGPDGSTYWTCKSAGVILERTALGEVTVLRSGLAQPTGIALDPWGKFLYWTEVPTPGVSGANGGRNRVVRMNLETNAVNVINMGDPEPTDIAVSRRGVVYWTCTSAGVIVQSTPR